MLESIKTCIEELPEVSFGEFYQNYICEVQDLNVMAEIGSIKPSDMYDLGNLLAKLGRS